MSEPKQHAKTLWDWLNLLGVLAIPVVVGLGAAWYTAQQGKVSDRENTDNQRETALQAYIDKMSDIILDNKLRESGKEDEVRNIARIRTLTALRRLDAERKGNVIQFLKEAGLINAEKSIVILRGADLSYADLTEVNLSGTDLRGADFTGADLPQADLTGAFLSRADLKSADLMNANLTGAFLSRADLSEAILRADLIYADLRGAQLINANLLQANLYRARLNRADLSNADLRGAQLNRADLSNADLSRLGLSEADLSPSEADLSGATVTQHQLEKA